MPHSGRKAPSALEALGGRIGRHGSIYGGALLVTLALGLLNVAVLTRFLAPGPFGDLAVLLVFSSLLTVVFNLGVLQGAMRVAYGTSDEELGGSHDADVGPEDGRRMLGSAIGFTFTLAVAGVLFSYAFREQLSDWLLGHPGGGTAVVWAAASGGLGAVWRVVVNLLRLDRRPIWWGIAQNLRPALALAVAIPLVADGGGATAVLAGLTIGTAASLALATALTYQNYSFRLAPGDIPTVLKLGAGMVPVVIVFWLLANGDVFLLSRFAPAGDVGVYRVASRVGGTVAYLNSAVFMAWGPMLREPIHAAAERERGSGVVAPMLTRYYLMLGIGAVLALALFANYFAFIAPASYDGVAALIPLVGLAVLMHGAFIATYRTVEFEDKRNTFIWLVVVSGVVFLVAALALIPWLGSYGAVLATAISPAAGAALMIALARHQGDRTPLPFKPLALALVAAGLCLLLGTAAATLPAPIPLVGRSAAFVLFPFALVLLGAVPRGHVASLIGVGRELLTLPDARARRLSSVLAGLPASDAMMIFRLARKRDAPANVAHDMGLSEPDLYLRFLGVLAALAGLDDKEFPAGVADYLLWRGAVSERDRRGLELWSAGVEPLDVDALQITLVALQRMATSDWPESSGAYLAQPLVAGDPVSP